jgi:hypothetical protein
MDGRSTKTPGRTLNASGAVLVALVPRSALPLSGSANLDAMGLDLVVAVADVDPQ